MTDILVEILGGEEGCVFRRSSVEKPLDANEALGKWSGQKKMTCDSTTGPTTSKMV